ncbi:MAG TPA: ATP-binding protein [Flavobacteriales bacterium]|nr:ATP-binding protein [Flavobacteriales bacterium]HRJ38486.1 ATP-binding protein [Flavobacteriales bacterium]
MPILSVTGPRQSGKTTLVREVFSGHEYVNLENPNTLEEVKFDPEGFLRQRSGGLIIDEAQHFPELFSFIQVISDEVGKKGEFVLTGSQHFLLSQRISQSLAGRVFVTHLLPCTISEANRFEHWRNSPNAAMYSGFYPRIHESRIEPHLFYPSYIQTYIERDVRQIINITRLGDFQRFMRLLAGRVGQVMNYSALANEVGVDMKTIKAWTQLLEASFVVFLLQPHHANYNKRIVKSPKLYFYDTGLVCNLLGVQSQEQLDAHWVRGSLFENMVIADIKKYFHHHHRQLQLYFWRDSNGNEVDLLIEHSDGLDIAEIKSSTSVNASFFKGLDYYSGLNQSVKRSFLIYGGEESRTRGRHLILPWHIAAQQIAEV